MSENNLPISVYRQLQKEFRAITGYPWIYWISEGLRAIYKEYPTLDSFADPKQGLATADNFRFLRMWWECGIKRILFGENDYQGRKKWYPCLKGGSEKRWYGNQEYVLNWKDDGKELRTFSGSVIRNPTYYFREGITWSLISSGKPSFRWIQPGWIITHKGPGIYTNDTSTLTTLIAILNSSCATVLLKTISPTIGYEIGQLAILPFPQSKIANPVRIMRLVRLSFWFESIDEITFDFIVPLDWVDEMQKLADILGKIGEDEVANDDDVFDLYGITLAERFSIERELTGETIDEDNTAINSEDEGIVVSHIASEEVAVRWISYATGIVLGRFQPGNSSGIGRAVYSRKDFIIGSLPPPDQAEFDELVGPPERFAYIDEQGGRHVFSREAEAALRELALPDGIAVLDAGHPRDLPTLVEKALVIMLGEKAAREVIETATGSNGAASPGESLRKFLEKDFFTQWHFKWYRKRPVYWPVQSQERNYGFVLFHERITKDTIYALQQDPYLKTKRNAVALRIQDLQAALENASGSKRKQLEKELADLQSLAEELAQFAQDLEAITLGGYEPEPDWIDDGVILRMAPLWPVIPAWKSEPKKYWERLERGENDWAHLAMKYWPKRVRVACREKKSYAIAHGHEEWYEGD